MLSAFCLIGMDKTIVLNPVIALNVLDTEESIPPDTPITNDLAFLAYYLRTLLSS